MTENILEEALRITSQDRRREYGPASKEFERAAEMWSTLLRKKLKEPLTAEDYALCMIVVKLIRYSHKSQRDSLADIAGYARTIEMLTEEDNETFFDRQYKQALQPLVDKRDQGFSFQTMEGVCTINNKLRAALKPCPTCKRCICDKCETYHNERCGVVPSSAEAFINTGDVPAREAQPEPRTMSGLQSPFAKLAAHHNMSQSEMISKMYEEPVLVPEELRKEIGAHNIAFANVQANGGETYRADQEEAGHRYQHYIENSARSPLEHTLDKLHQEHTALSEEQTAQAFIRGSDRDAR